MFIAKTTKQLRLAYSNLNLHVYDFKISHKKSLSLIIQLLQMKRTQ